MTGAIVPTLTYEEMLTLARIFCGDPPVWDPEKLAKVAIRPKADF